MKIMFSHYDEAARSVALHVEGSTSAIYLGSIEDPLIVSEIAQGGEKAIARVLLEKRILLETLSELAGIDVSAAERAVRSYWTAGPRC